MIRTVLFLVIGGVVTPSPAPSTIPNVVFILTDDPGWADTTPYGQTKFFEALRLTIQSV
jgi:arylsulfatase A-like enzyme